MKKIAFVFLTLLSSFAFAQDKFMPAIKQGSKLNYAIVTNDGAMVLVIRLDSIASDFMKLGWMTENQSKGSWIMKKQSIENATGGYWDQLQPDMAVELGADKSTVFLSKAQWNALKQDKKMTFDMKTYLLKTPSDKQQFRLGNQLVDALFLESEDNSSRIWLLNNPTFPVMLKIEGNVAGVDAELKSIE